MPEFKNASTWLNEKYTNLMNQYISKLGTWVSESQKIDLYRKFLQLQKDEEKDIEDNNVTMELIERWINSNDPKYRNTCNSQANTHRIAKAIKKRVANDPTFWWDLSDSSDNEVMDWYYKNNPTIKNEAEKAIRCEIDVSSFLRNNWLEKSDIWSSSTFWTALWVIWGLWAWAIWAAGAFAWTDAFWNFADWVYRQNINQHSRDSINETKRWSLKDSIAESKKELSKLWDWVKSRQEATLYDYYESRINELQQALDNTKDVNERANIRQELYDLQKDYNEFTKNADSRVVAEWNIKDKQYYEDIIKRDEAKLKSMEETPLTRETAYDKWIRWFTNRQIARQADAAQMNLWNNEIGKYINKSTSKIDMKWIIDNINIDEISALEWDKDKLQAAWDLVKRDYNNSSYWELSAKQAQEIKNNLYKKLPSWTWNGKDITNQYKQILYEVSQWMKEELENKLSEEFGWDFKTKYREWWNLKELATDEINALNWKWAAWGRAWIINNIWWWVVTPLSSEWGYYLKKLNEWIKSIPWKIKNVASDLFWYVKENPVKAVKEWVKWLTKEMPATMIFDDMIEKQEYVQSNPFAQSVNALSVTPESQWTKLYDKSEVESMLKDPNFRDAADTLWFDLNNLAKKFNINTKEVNATVDKQNKQKAEDNKNKLSLSAKIENENKKNKTQNGTINQLNKITSLKSQKTTVWTKKKSSK